MDSSDSCCAEVQRTFWDVSLDLLIAQAKRVDAAIVSVKADDAESPYFIWRGGTCRICAPRTGNIYRWGVDPSPPAHPNCRCYAEPYWGEVRSPLDILNPDEITIGMQGMRPNVRILSGGDEAARAMYERLSAGGIVDTPLGYPGVRTRLPNGDFIGYRPLSRSGEPSIDLDISGFPYTKIKFLD
jgi:hypothetical protein